jgi:hypothetical protein
MFIQENSSKWYGFLAHIRCFKYCGLNYKFISSQGIAQFAWTTPHENRGH